jgi:glutaminase
MDKTNYQKILGEIAAETEKINDLGNVASYIPELSNVNPKKLGVHLTTIKNDHYFYGDSNEKFSIQSIAKVLALALALKIEGENIWNRVGVEPSGSAFNSLVQLEYERGIPRNPLINPGAIVICDILVSCLTHPKDELLEFVRQITGISDICYCKKTAASEAVSGYRNYALANLMKDFGNIHNSIESVLDVYFHLCSIMMTCKELAQTFLFLSSHGVSPITGKIILTPRQAKRINAIMLMCGFYDEAGEFAFRTGLPGKSGVGGGIVAIHPWKYAIAVWSPKLNNKGNSYKGMKVLEALTTKTRSSIF